MYRSNWKYPAIFNIIVALSLVVLLLPLVIGRASALAANGPWLVYTVGSFDAPTQLWVANADGSNKTELAHDIVIVAFAPSPTGHHLAYIAAENHTDSFADLSKLTLHLLTLPGGQDKIITRLTNSATEPAARGAREFAIQAIDGAPGSLQWSPDSKSLAFIGAQVGSTANLFVYSLATNSIRQLSSASSTHSSQAVSPSWSPDSKSIVYSGVDNFGSGAGWRMAGTWAANANGSGTTLVYHPQPDDGAEWVVGWIGPSVFLTATSGPNCGYNHLRAFDLKTRQATPWFAGPFDDAAWSPDGQTLWFTVDDYKGYAVCQANPPGIYLSSPAVPSPHLISAAVGKAVRWSPGARKFFIGPGRFAIPGDHQVSIVSAIGEPGDNYALDTIPNVSPDGKYWAWIERGATVLNASPAANLKAEPIAENVALFDWLP